MQGESSKLRKSGKKYPVLKMDRGNMKETPPATNDGHVIGSAPQSKGFDHKKLIKHDGMVIGGSVTKKQTPTPEKSINQLPSGGKRNIVGSD